MYKGVMHLADYMAQHELTDEEVAEKIGTSRVSVSRYRRKLVRPDWDVIEKIRTFTDGQVTADDFVQLEAAE